MSQLFQFLDEQLKNFIQAQPLFFVATAPLSGDGHVNLSPKGLDAFRILDPHTVAYLDLTGSGIETVAHVRENGRISIMFCSFDSNPKIVRLQGKGEVHDLDDPEFKRLIPLFPEIPGTRSIIRIHLDRISDSCGWGVPIMDFKEQRRTLVDFAAKFTPEQMEQGRQKKNARSIDGLPGVRARIV